MVSKMDERMFDDHPHIHVMDLRYGENPHQDDATLFMDISYKGPSIATARQIHGEKELSYNNILDSDAGLRAILEFKEETAVCVIKHYGERGFATGPSGREAFLKAYYGNEYDSYGGVVASTVPLDAEMMKATRGKFIEVIVAPYFTEEALDVLNKRLEREEKKDNTRKWRNCRLLELGDLTKPEPQSIYRQILGGVLTQSENIELFGSGVTGADLKSVTGIEPTVPPGLIEFAYKVLKHMISNKALVARSYISEGKEYYQLIGEGEGQGARVDASQLAVTRARKFFEREAKSLNILPTNDYIDGQMSTCIFATGAFFAKVDGPQTVYRAGIRNTVCPFGSKEDENVIAFSKEHGIAMLDGRLRHFKH